MERFGLRDDQWNRIKDILPGREGHVGGTAADNRLFVEAVLYRFRTLDEQGQGADRCRTQASFRFPSLRAIMAYGRNNCSAGASRKPKRPIGRPPHADHP